MRSVVTGGSECRSEGGQGSVQWVVQAVDTIMMAGRGGRAERPNVVAARVIGNLMLREQLWRELELREATESRSHNIGSLKMVLTVTSESKPMETVIGEPDTSVYRV